LATSSATDLWEQLAEAAAAQSRLWSDALLPPGERTRLPVFSPLAEGRFALGVETIYEGYLVLYGCPRLFAPVDDDAALLLGDYLYAHGLARIAALGGVKAVLDLAHLISLCARLRGDGASGDGEAWAATAALLGRGRLDGARAALRDGLDSGPLAALAREAAGGEPVDRALVAHARLLG
jgi:hypothetical protein